MLASEAWPLSKHLHIVCTVSAGSQGVCWELFPALCPCPIGRGLGACAMAPGTLD